MAGSTWFGGRGVDVFSNGGVGRDSTSRGPYGFLYQCVELINRFVVTRGWSPIIPGNASSIYGNAQGRYFDKHPDRSGYTPVPGDIVVFGGGVRLSGCLPSGCGHVAIVEGAGGGFVNVVEQNSSPSGRNALRIDGAGHITPASSRGTTIGVLHAKANAPATEPVTPVAPVPQANPAPTTTTAPAPAQTTAPTSTTPQPVASPAPTQTPVSTPAPTWAEQQGHHGVNTFTNPYNASGMGPKIAPAQVVQVACKVYAPQIASANPDGYWYRIASTPWNGLYYSPANTFMNGDPWNGPYSHNTDFAVPNC